MSSKQIDYDSVAEIYDLYVAADYDIPFFVHETANVKGPGPGHVRRDPRCLTCH